MPEQSGYLQPLERDMNNNESTTQIVWIDGQPQLPPAPESTPEYLEMLKRLDEREAKKYKPWMDFSADDLDRKCSEMDYQNTWYRNA